MRGSDDSGLDQLWRFIWVALFYLYLILPLGLVG